MNASRKWMRASLWLFLVISTAGLLLTFVVEEGMRSRAVEVQPVARDAAGENGWRLAGPTVELIGIPKTAYVTSGGPGIPPQVNVAAIQTDSNAVSLDSIQRTIVIARIGAFAAAILLVLGLWAERRITA